MSKIVRKSLAGEEDLLLGRSAVQANQLRGTSTVPVTPLDLVHGIVSTAQLKALDTSKHFFAVHYTGGALYMYAFDSASTEVPDDITYFQPTVGSGRWKKFTL